MSSLFNWVYKLATALREQFSSHLQSLGRSTVTGILGLALLLFGYYQIRDFTRTRRPRQNNHYAPQQPSQTRTDPVPTAQKPTSLSHAPVQAALSPLGAMVMDRLNGVKRVTVSVPGVLIKEETTSDLRESASMIKEALDIVQEMAKRLDVFVLSQVSDDVGQALVQAALDPIIGTGPGKLPAHRILFCSTLDGKSSIVRQLEPDFHIDAHPTTVDALKRFIPQLLYISAARSDSAPQGANIGASSSLSAFFTV